MRDFKKLLLPAFSIIVSIFIVSVLVIECLMTSEYYHCCDNKNRDNLAGSITMLFSGASHGMNGFNAAIIDDEMGCVSYNLSGPAMGFRARYKLLEQEIKRNPVDTVVIDITFNSLLKGDKFESELYALPRISSFQERMKYWFTMVPFGEVWQLYGNLMHDGFYVMTSKLVGKSSILGTDELDNVDYSAKGFRRNTPNDLTLDDAVANQIKNSSIISTEYPDDNLKYLGKMIDLCNENNIRVIIVVVPVSDGLIWRYDEWHLFQDYMKAYAAERDIEYFDFNLLKDRYDVYSDAWSFADEMHLSGTAADLFSKQMCDVLKLSAAGNDCSNLFYDSYETMKAESPYALIDTIERE